MTAGDPSEALVLTLARDAHAPAVARRSAVAAADGLVAGRRRSDLELLVSEVVSNAVLHGRGDITIVVRLEVDGVRVAVTDGSAELPRQRSTTGANGGFGLRLLEELSVTWGVEISAAGKTVWFCL